MRDETKMREVATEIVDDAYRRGPKKGRSRESQVERTVAILTKHFANPSPRIEGDER